MCYCFSNLQNSSRLSGPDVTKRKMSLKIIWLVSCIIPQLVFSTNQSVGFSLQNFVLSANQCGFDWSPLLANTKTPCVALYESLSLCIIKSILLFGSYFTVPHVCQSRLLEILNSALQKGYRFTAVILDGLSERGPISASFLDQDATFSGPT